MLVSRTDQHAEERAEVEVLFAKAKKHADLGKQIQASLARMKERDQFWRQAKESLYNDTEPARVIKRNVAAIMEGVKRVRQPLEGKADEERVLRDRVLNVGVTNYLASLRRVQRKHAELLNAPMRVNVEAAQDLGQLLGFGENQLTDLFSQIVRSDIERVEPLHYTTKNLPFPCIPDKPASDMAAINSFFGASHLRNGPRPSQTLNVYVEARSPYISASLQNLSIATISLAKGAKPDEIYQSGTNGIGMYALGMEGMLAAEWKTINTVFMPDECGLAFSMTVAKAVQDLQTTLSELEVIIRPKITTQGFLAFEVIDVISSLAYNVDSMTRELKHDIVEALRPIREMAKEVVKELIEDIRRKLSGLPFTPKGNAALPMTTEVMRRLQTLVSFPQSLASILTSVGDKNWMHLGDGNASTASLSGSKSFDVGPDGTQLMANYSIDTIDVLCELIDGKSRTLLKEKANQGLFLANNVCVIETHIRSSALVNILPAASRTSKLEVWRKKGLSQYTDAWRGACAALMDVQYTNRGPRPPSGNAASIDSAAIVKGLGSKEKDAIKKKFDQFNMVFGELLSQHKDYLSAMQPDVKQQLANDIYTMINPLYSRFWDRYHEIDKGKGKHVKYDKAGLATQLQSLNS